MLRTDATVPLRCNRTMQTDMKRPAKSPAKTNTVEPDQPCEIAGRVVRNCRARGEHSVEPGARLALVLHPEVPPTTGDASDALLTMFRPNGGYHLGSLKSSGGAIDCRMTGWRSVLRQDRRPLAAVCGVRHRSEQPD